MSLISFCHSINSIMSQCMPLPRGSLLLYTVTWPILLTVTVVLTSFIPELAFFLAMVPSTGLSEACGKAGYVRLPLDIPSENLCFPVQLLERSRFDFLMPPVFAAVMVTGSACLIRAMGLWEVEDDQQF